MHKVLDYLIIGAGPAGLQLGYFLQQNKRDYLILEKWHKPGKFFNVFPRHRFLISINKVHTGKDNPEVKLRYDWNSLLSDNEELRFTKYSEDYFPHPDLLVKYLEDFANYYQLRIQYNATVTKISKPDNDFLVTDAEGNTYTSKRLVVATGFTKLYEPDFPGWELCDTYINQSVDPKDYIDQRVLIVGKGNSAFETADNLTGAAAVIHVLSPHSVKMAWATHYVGNLRAINNNFLDTYQLKSQNTVIDGSIMRIEKTDGKFVVDIAYSHAQGQTRRLTYDKVILCTGFRFDASIFDESCKPDLIYNGKLPAQTHEWESTTVSDLYFAGTLMQACDFKKTMSGFIHGFRYNVKALSNIFEMKYHGVPWPSQTIDAHPSVVLEKVFDRINNASGMFLQPGFLCDVVIIDELSGKAHYYEDLRMDYVSNSLMRENPHYYIISLEYGHYMGGDPFNIERDPDPDKGSTAFYLHPIIRRYHFGDRVTEHHVQDDVENEWYLEEYMRPARVFFNAQLSNFRDIHSAMA